MATIRGRETVGKFQLKSKLFTMPLILFAYMNFFFHLIVKRVKQLLIISKQKQELRLTLTGLVVNSMIEIVFCMGSNCIP